MPSLYLLRHGASDWRVGQRGDHGRPLNALGREEAALIGRYLGRVAEVPDGALCSSAARTQETLDRAQRGGGWSVATEILDELYETTVESAIETIRSRGARSQRLLLVGHQPTLSGLAAALTGGGWVQMNTATLLRIDFRCDSWSHSKGTTGEIVWQVNPSMLSALNLVPS